MSKRLSIAHIFSFIGLLNCGYTFTDEITQDISLTQHISSRYINATFGEEKTITPPQITENETFLDKFYKAVSPKSAMLPKKELLSKREIQTSAFDIVSASKTFESPIVDKFCIDKLELIGGGENSQQHLFGNIFSNINTAIGKAHAALTFCHPTTDVSTLHKRQKAIALLCNSKLNAFESALEKISFNEKKSFIFWSSKKPVNEDILKTFYFNIDTLKPFNTNTIALETTNKLIQSFEIAMGTLNIPLSIGIQFYAQAQHHNMTCGQFYNAIKPLLIANRYAIATTLAIPLGIQYLMAHGMVKGLQNTGQVSNHLQDILISTASYVNELKKLSSLINKNKQLLTNLPSLQPLADFNNATKHSTQLNKLLSMLDTNTFKGEPSFWSITGRVLAAYDLMTQVKNELAPVFAAAGELDMYVALAKLYSSREGKDARYCMVNFVENSSTPIIDARNFWNPFVNPDTVVINDATFDTSCQNIILTGPNTGGKSTVIKGIMLNVLMAQTFGIAPSQSLTMTPFTKLNCFMNISDDIATGASLFKSEVMRAKKLLDMVQALNKNEFSFVIIDEVFTGTSPQEGEAAAIRFAKHLGTYANNIGIIATHYPKMVDLETETNGTFRNHHVEILRNEDGSLNRTFKFKTGPSFFNVAFDILEEEGLFV